ncbi:MerR family transcriptional regulator [Priestia aryabhattai]|uniref:MerR family transcriptional regulator n=1 Tax=Priestia megaterium TaxID=1404 RepID=UPI0039B93574
MKIKEKVRKDNENSNVEKIEFFKRIHLHISELSEITGIPQSTLENWEKKGFILSTLREDNVPGYDYINVKKVLLIQEALKDGYELTEAVEIVEKRNTYLYESLRRFIEAKRALS